MAEAYKVAVSIPTEGNTQAEAYDNRLMFAFHLGKLETNNPKKYEFYWFTAGRQFVPMAREQLIINSINNNMDYCFMIDDDMISDIDILEKLLKRMEDDVSIDIIAPLAFTRNPPYKAVLYETKMGFDPIEKTPYFTTKYINNYPKDTLIECDAVGFGAALIKLEKVKRMKPPYFMSTSPTGEDILFCVNMKKIGAKICMDTSVKLGHLSNPTIITEDFVNTWKKQNAIN